MQQVTIRVDKKDIPALPPVLDEIFARSQAISMATSLFWDLKKADSATLGQVREQESTWEVDIMY